MLFKDVKDQYTDPRKKQELEKVAGMVTLARDLKDLLEKEASKAQYLQNLKENHYEDIKGIIKRPG